MNLVGVAEFSSGALVGSQGYVNLFSSPILFWIQQIQDRSCSCGLFLSIVKKTSLSAFDQVFL